MEPDTKDRDSMYRLIISQLYHDDHNQLARDLSNSIGLKSSPPPSDKLFQLVFAAQKFANGTDEEEKDNEMQMSLNALVPSIDTLTIDGDYFPILALPPHNLDLVFSSLAPKDRMALAGVNKILNKIESESKYYVENLAIVEISAIPAPLSSIAKCLFEDSEHSIVLFENRSYSSDFLRRIAHNAAIGELWIELNGSSEFHREICNLVKEIEIGELYLFTDQELVEPFILDLARSCKELHIRLDSGTPEIIHEFYKILLNGSAKIRLFNSDTELEKCVAFLRLIGITFRDGRFYSSRDIEVYKDKIYEDEEEDDEEEEDVRGRWHIFDGHLEIILYCYASVDFKLLHHEKQESLEKAKNEEGMRRIEIVPE